jgi:hypothetical protein
MNAKLRHSIITLCRIKNQLKNAEDAMMYLFHQKDKVINSTWDNAEIAHLDTALYGLIYYSLIWYASFLDEYNNHFSPAEDPNHKQKIISVRKNCKKFTQNIVIIFGDVTIARNLVLAHPYRKSNGTPLTNKEINNQFDQLILHPTIGTYTQLSNMANLIYKEIEIAFGPIPESEISLIEEELESL